MYDVLAVVLTDLIVFLQKNEQKYTFLMQDNKVMAGPVSQLIHVVFLCCGMGFLNVISYEKVFIPLSILLLIYGCPLLEMYMCIIFIKYWNTVLNKSRF